MFCVQFPLFIRKVYRIEFEFLLFEMDKLFEDLRQSAENAS